MDSSGSGYGSSVSFYEHGNKPSGSIKNGEFPYKLNVSNFSKTAVPLS